VPISPQTSNLLRKNKRAVSAAFLLMLLLAALPFSLSAGGSDSNHFQTATATPTEAIDLNEQGTQPSVNSFTEPVAPTQPSISGTENTAENNSAEPSPTQSATTTFLTRLSIQVRPNSIALGDTLSLIVTVSPSPPTPTDHFSNLTLRVYRPDGTVDLLGPFESDSNGTLKTSYKPEMIGTYTTKAAYEGQLFANQNVMYLAVESSTETFNVLSEAPTPPRTLGIWIVDDDGPADFHTIQEAINAASDGDTILVRSGIYNENVIVNKSVSLSGEDKSNTVVSGGSAGNVFSLVTSNVSISGFTIRTSTTGYAAISIDGTTPFYSRDNIISGNQFFCSGDCFFLFQASGNIIQNNTITGGTSWGHGIYMELSTNNTIMGNNLFSCYSGICLDFSSNNNLFKNNHIVQSTHSFGTVNNYLGLSQYINDVDSSNTVDGKPIYYLVSKSNLTIPSDAGCVILVNCTHMIVQNLSLTRAHSAVLLAYTNNSTIINNNIANNAMGIELQHSDNNLLSRNNISSNINGIFISSSSSNIIMENNLTKSRQSQITIYCESSSNSIYRNNFFYVLQYYSNGTNLVPSKQVIHVFMIKGPGGALVFEYTTNAWDNGKEGNYWSDYGGNDANGDGVGDTPIVIDINNTDHLPLMAPSHPS
jgi:parallel beta-helix repeat protein